MELTVPWDTKSNMTAALQRKTERYENLATEIKDNGFRCSNIPLEIGTRGVVNARNRAVLAQLCHGLKVNKVSCVTKNCSKLALLGSYTIWNARYSTDWTGSGFLKPWRATHLPHSDQIIHVFSLFYWSILTSHNWCSAIVLGELSPGAMWSLIIPLMDTVVNMLQFIGSTNFIQ